MRYYLYISDAKVDMLLPQIPGAVQHKVAATLGFDLKLLSGSLSTERRTLDTREARLRAVEEAVKLAYPIGSPERPESWIEGSLEVRSVSIGDDAVLFVSTASSWLLGLAGSAHHLIGSRTQEGPSVPFSFLSRMVDRMLYISEQRPEIGLSEDDGAVARALVFRASGKNKEWIDLLQIAAHRASGPPQQIHFLAKRLFSSLDGDTRVTLATPLYVALGD